MASVRSIMPAFDRHLPCGTGCCWWNWDELEAVYKWMYSKEPELIKRAVGRVAAWKARGSLPLMIEVTADLMECQQWEGEHRRDDITDQALSLMYSMAITRFINGVRDECVAISRTTIREILHVVSKVGIPSWIVTLRHLGTHQYLPSLASFRAGAEFALSWLDAHYWKPQLRMRPAYSRGVGSASREREGLTPVTAEPEPVASGQTDTRADRVSDRQTDGQSNDPDKSTRDSVEKIDVIVVEDSPKVVLTQQDLNLFSGSRQYVQKLKTKPQLVKAIAEADCSTLVDYIKEGLVLVFSPPLNYDILVPDITDLASLPQLRFHLKRRSSPSPAFWQGHTLGLACKKERSTKHKLVAALVMAMHEAECCPKSRDFLGAWLKLFLEQRELETERVGRVDVVGVVAAKKQALPGRVDWKKLLETARTHPGYYSYALVKIILDHIGATLPKEVTEKLTYATTLLTLSERIGVLEFAVRKSAGTGKYVEKVEELLKAAKENVRSRTKRGLAGGVTGKRTACIRDGSRDKQGGEIGEIPAGGRKGDETEVPSAKRPRVEEREASGEGDEEQAVSDDEDVVIVGVTRGKKKSRWNAVSDVETWVRCPLGVCPGQELTPTLLDLPAEVDRAIEGTSPPVDYLQYYRSGTGTAVEQIPDNNDDHVPSTAAANSDDQETNQLLTKKEIKLIQKKVRLF